MTRPHGERILAAMVLILATFCRVNAAHAGWKESQDAGRNALAAGDLDKAEQEMKEAIVAAKKLGPDHQSELAEAFAGLSDVFLKQARMTEANLLLEQSLILLAQTPGADRRVLDQIYCNLATVRIFQKNLPEAESLLRRALVLREERLGRDHPDVAQLLDRLADMPVGDAPALHDKALAIRENAPGASPADVIKSLNEGADWYKARGDGQAAEAIWRRLLLIQEKTLGAAHHDVADTLMKIVADHLEVSATSYLTMWLDPKTENLFLNGTWTRARLAKERVDTFGAYEPMLARALAIREQSLGRDHADTIRVVQYLASGYLLRDDWARARPLNERILTLREKTLGPEHPDLTGPLSIQARAAMMEHRYRDAIPLLKRATAIQAAENANAQKRDGRPAVRASIGEELAGDDPEDYAAQLRKAIRLADLDQTPDARPTEQDLAFFKSQGWCPASADLSSLPEWTSVVFGERRVDNASLAHIRGLVNLKSLVVNPQHLRYTKPNIDDSDLAQLRHLTALKRLDLRGTAIHGPGLSALKKMNELRWLDLSFTFVDDAGLTVLPTLPNLEHLELSGTEVSDASIPVLQKLNGLKELWVNHTKFSDQGVEDLKQTMPEVRVFGIE